MKHKGSISITYKKRDRVVLPRLIRQARHLATYPTTTKQLLVIAANLPTDRFYISDDAAYAYVSRRYMHNDTPQLSNKYKTILFEALYEEVMKMMKEEKYKTMSLKNITILALSRPAPCVGLSPGTIKNIKSMVKLKKHE
jgi:hypothetical protein